MVPPLACKFVQQLHDFLAGLGIQVAGRLIGHKQRRIVDQRAGNRHPLPLAARQFIGS